MKGAIALAVLLSLLWAGLSGPFSREPIVFVMAVISVSFAVALSLRMDRVAGEPGLPPEALRMLPRLPWYLAWLAWQIVLANVQVARLVLSPRLRLEPQLLRVPARQRSELAQVIHANSITLTPGTVTLDLRGGELLVHALDVSTASGVVDGTMDRAASRLEGGKRTS